MKRSTAIVAFALTVSGCEGTGQSVGVSCGPLDDFPPVSLVLERRCGTLDCHGDLARPLRIYSAGGLRLTEGITEAELANSIEEAVDAGRVSGGVGTTEAEFEANWRSVCSLEPVKTNRVVSGELAPEDLMLLRKPLLRERHKGGRLFQTGDAGSVCVSCWVRGFPDDVDACQDALQGCADAIENQL